jgi:UDP-N-acetylmuramate--alanine ligase
MEALNKIVASINSSTNTAEAMPAIYFIGIGGIGMSALARYFNAKGCQVSGYDKTETLLCKQLQAEGIQIHYQDSIALLNKNAVLVVYTPAIPKGHLELAYYQQNNYVVVKRSDVLGAITNTAFNICIAGTHGKTTTSTMVAHILRHSNFGCNAFLGGIATNYNSNFWSNPKNVCVVEADEYDRSFLKLSPDIAIITSMDADHLDIYGTAENVEQAFIDFSAKVKQGGWLISKYGLPRSADLISAMHITYHASNDKASVYASNIKMINGTYQFDVYTNNKSWQISSVVLNMGGMHNVENVVAAITVAHHAGISHDKIKAAVADFKGVKRRFEYIIAPSNDENAVLQIDDYAHHPEELKKLIDGAKKLFPAKKCTLIFQPHLYSRTQDFALEFAQVLDMADEVILLPIYPARELPIPGVNSEMIMGLMKNKQVKVLSKDEVVAEIKSNKKSMIITAGAGDIDLLVQPIKQAISNSVEQ